MTIFFEQRGCRKFTGMESISEALGKFSGQWETTLTSLINNGYMFRSFNQQFLEIVIKKISLEGTI